MGILQARILEWVAMPSFRRSSNPGIKPMSPALQVDSLPSELQRREETQASHGLPQQPWDCLCGSSGPALGTQLAKIPPCFFLTPKCQSIIQFCCFYLQNRSRIWPLLTVIVTTATTLAHATVVGRSLLSGLQPLLSLPHSTKQPEPAFRKNSSTSSLLCVNFEWVILWLMSATSPGLKVPC